MSFVDSMGAVFTGRETEQVSRSSLATRLSAAYFGMSFLLIVVSSGILYWGTVYALQSADDQVLDKRLLTLREILVSPDTDEGYVGHEVSEDLEGPRRVFMRVVSDVYELGVETPEMPPGLSRDAFPDVSKAPLDVLKHAVVYTPDGRYRVVTARVPIAERWGAPTAILQVAVDTTRDDEVLAWFRTMLFGLFLGAAVVCWVAARVLVNRELRPLREIASATSRIGTETLDYRLSLKQLPAELEELATNFNAMLARLETAYTGLRQYADNVAHELRSPVNKMLLACEVALLKARSVAEYREHLETNLEELARLSTLLQSLLFLARADNAQTFLEREEFDLAAELHSIAQFFQATADDASVGLSVAVEPHAKCHADKVLLQRAISNLVANAITHTPKGGSVLLRARSENGCAIIEVEDTGCGIDPVHLPHIFDRFYRADQVRSPTEAHAGLGLPITKSIVELHGGNISLKSTVGQGTIFTMTVPPTGRFDRKPC